MSILADTRRKESFICCNECSAIEPLENMPETHCSACCKQLGHCRCEGGPQIKSIVFPQGWWRKKGSDGHQHLCPLCSPRINRILADRRLYEKHYQEVYLPARIAARRR